MHDYWLFILEEASCVGRKIPLWLVELTLVCLIRIFKKKKKNWLPAEGADYSSSVCFMCFCVLELTGKKRKQRKATLRLKWSKTIVCKKTDSTLLFFSSLTPSNCNFPFPGFLLFFLTLLFPWQLSRRLTPGRGWWPWSPFLEWGEDGRGGKKPHFTRASVDHKLSCVTFMEDWTRAEL